MRRARCFFVWRPTRGGGCIYRLSGLFAIFVCVGFARGDVLTLTSGGTVEGEIVQQNDEGYTVKTAVGMVRLARDMVLSIKAAPSPFAEYEQRRAQVQPTAASHFALAEWCGKRGFYNQRRAHLQRSIALDADFEPARKALGYVRVGAMWVDGRKSAPKKPPSPAKPKVGKDASAGDDALDDRTLVEAIQNTWNRRIRAIKQTYLTSRLPKMVDKGRERILAIKDPLAILPLTKNLGKGTLMQRRLLVTSLAEFKQDESTMNLAVMALVDRNGEIRRAAISQLIQRHDQRVPAQFRKALGSKNGELVQRAAFALAALDRKEVVGDLIEVLTGRARLLIDVPVRSYFGEFSAVFAGDSSVRIGQQRSVRIRPQIGVVDSRGVVSVEMEQQMQDVTVFRTEVLEALKRLTGQNFGFEHEKWRLWYQENMQ